jgi:type IV fimbrial biogenesis protein FimT
MQVLSRQRDVSLIEMRESENAGTRASGGDSMDVRHIEFAQVVTQRHGRGFTLVELMITMAVALVLIMIAVPSFKNLTLSNKLTTTANDIVGAINIARMEAVKRNASAQLCSNTTGNNTSDTLGSACTTETGSVYILTGGTPATTQVLVGTSGITSPIQLNGDMKAVRFTGQGLGQAAGTSTSYSGTIVDICTSQMSTDNHRVIEMAAGSIITTTTKSGHCPSS